MALAIVHELCFTNYLYRLLLKKQRESRKLSVTCTTAQTMPCIIRALRHTFRVRVRRIQVRTSLGWVAIGTGETSPRVFYRFLSDHVVSIYGRVFYSKKGFLRVVGTRDHGPDSVNVNSIDTLDYFVVGQRSRDSLNFFALSKGLLDRDRGMQKALASMEKAGKNAGCITMYHPVRYTKQRSTSPRRTIKYFRSIPSAPKTPLRTLLPPGTVLAPEVIGDEEEMETGEIPQQKYEEAMARRRADKSKFEVSDTSTARGLTELLAGNTDAVLAPLVELCERIAS